ncbi:hypothetical protein SAMN06264346_101677 [Chryseobacterium profundimaris]|uniref:Lipoprotein n=2 Tax=Chryseobacterium profundimaris TaxID=1387275 RepID=A0ABY1NEF7_9FLAO|nr:hypothetical protein SAMN06264346_101677 [Chryseobacterium profundimaris]
MEQRNIRKGILFIIALISIASCTQDNKKQPNILAKKPSDKSMVHVKSLNDSTKIETRKSETDTSIEVMNDKDILYNGKFKRYFSINRFYSLLGQPDSIKFLIDENPCTSIFEEPEGTPAAEEKYLYKNGTRFENSGEKVAIDKVCFHNGNFILFKNIVLNKRTSLAQLKKLFPNALKRSRIIEIADIGKLQVIELREDEDNVSDGLVKIYIYKGRLYSLHWWFPC